MDFMLFIINKYLIKNHLFKFKSGIYIISFKLIKYGICILSSKLLKSVIFYLRLNY